MTRQQPKTAVPHLLGRPVRATFGEQGKPIKIDGVIIDTMKNLAGMVAITIHPTSEADAACLDHWTAEYELLDEPKTTGGQVASKKPQESTNVAATNDDRP